ncbi:zf-HC2 domain-containing protein, partial [candidate division KSB1 bacterium]|nr:zf-HC2 domain-containing protein [candidate division KSB1 bacterium]
EDTMHVTDNQILLYLTQYGLTEQKRQEFESHLIHCEDCNARIEHFSGLLSKVTTENRLECEQIEDDLIDYNFGDLDTSRMEQIKLHLDECESCRYLASRLKIAMAETNENHSRKSLSLPHKYQIMENVRIIKSKIGTIINLLISPLEPAPAFMGKNETRNLKRIQHSGGDLILNLNDYGMKASLLTLNNVELDFQISDECGLAIFSDFLPGMYHILIEGVQIKKLEYAQL